jgi:hypothetical protein
MSDAVKVTLPSGAVVTCSAEQAKRYRASEPKKAPAKKAASSKSEQ